MHIDISQIFDRYIVYETFLCQASCLKVMLFAHYNKENLLQKKIPVKGK